MSVEHFRRRADECRRLASDAHNAGDKAFWLALVERWQALEVRQAQQSVQDKSRPPLRRRPELARDLSIPGSPGGIGRGRSP